MTFLNSTPEPEVEFAKEIAAAEADFAKEPEPASEPEAKAEPTEEAAPPVKEPEPAAPEPVAKPEPPAHVEESRVPLKALQEARQEKQDLQRRLDSLEGYLQALQQQQQQPPEPQKDPLEQTDDPLAQLSAVTQEIRQIRQQQVQIEHNNRLSSAYVAAANEYAKETPDFMDAYNHLIQSRTGELKAMGYQEADIPRIVFDEEMRLADSAFKNRRNPAQVLYEYAKARGYAGPAPKTDAAQRDAQGRFVSTEPKAEEVVSLQRIKAEAATSISSGGKHEEAEISDADATKLTGDDFDKFWTKRFKERGGGSSLFRD